MSADEDVDVTNLTTAEREAVQEAIQAVVNRDVERVRELLSEPDQENADDFWMWANDYGKHGRLTLVAPPGGIEEWEVSGVALGDGTGFALDVPVWATVGRTDLTLQFELSREEAGEARVELHDMHVL